MPSSLQVTIADDYSDPFDAKNDLKSKAGKGESAGYMEPYEAQRIMTGKHRLLQLRGEVDGSRGPPPASAGEEGVCFGSGGWVVGTVLTLCHRLSVQVSLTSGRTGQGTVTVQR